MTVALAIIAYGVLETSVVLFGVGLVLQGAGHGLALPSLSSAVASAVPDKELGIASASNRLTAQVGTAFGITALTIVYGGDGSPESFARAFALGTALSLGSVLAAAAMGRRSAPHLDAPETDRLQAA
jgi:MFS family permease